MGSDRPLSPDLPGGTDRSRSVGILLLCVTGTLWSLSGVAVKVAGMDPAAFAFWRSAAAAGLLLLLLPFGAGRTPHPGWMLLSAVLYTATVALLITAMTLATAASGILLQYTAPAFCALFAWLFQRRRIDRRTALALIVAALGIAIMLLGSAPETSRVGALCGVASGAAFGGLILVLEKIDRLAHGRANPLLIVFYNNLGATIILLPLCLVLGTVALAPWQFAVVSATGIVQLAIPYILFQLALRRVHPVDASLLILIEPVLNPVWVALAVGERPDAATVIGGAAILVALVIEATKPRHGITPEDDL